MPRTACNHARIRHCETCSERELRHHPTFARPAPMPVEFKNIAGVRVRYAHAGSVDNPTVILLNPLPQSIVAFAPFWERFSSQFNLYAYDLPGFGRSDGGAKYMASRRRVNSSVTSSLSSGSKAHTWLVRTSEWRQRCTM